MAKQHIHIIKTGGTIEFEDPAYEEMNRKLMKMDTTIDSYINNLINPLFTFSSVSLMKKDSRQINDDDREVLYQEIMNTPHQQIVVTHGTFTMADTGRYLKHRDTGDKVIVLIGSMIPISGFAISDAGFNLGFVVGVMPSLGPGVHLAAQGAIHDPENVHKNDGDLRFEINE